MLALSEANLQTLVALEAAVKRVRDFTLLVVEAPHAGFGVQVRARLAALSGISLEDIPLDAPGLLGTLLSAGASAQDTRPVLLVREEEPLPEDLSATLSRLNERRNTLIRTRPGALIFCASAEGLTLLASAAPDLWSIRSDLFRLEVQPRAALRLESVLRRSMRISPEPSIHTGEELEALAAELEAAGNLREAARLWLRAGEAYSASPTALHVSGQAAEKAFLRAASLADQEDQPSLLGVALGYLGMLYSGQWRLEDSAFAMQRARQSFQRSGEPDLEVITLVYLWVILAVNDQHAEAQEALQQLNRFLQKSGNAANSAFALYFLGMFLGTIRRSAEAAAMLQTAQVLSQQAQDRRLEGWIRQAQGDLYRAAGQLKQAEASLTEALKLDLNARDSLDVLISLGEILLETERLVKAEATLRRAQALAVTHPDAQVQNRLQSLQEQLELARGERSG